MKTCSKCKIEQPLAAFYKNRSHADGRGNWCKSCEQEYKQSDAGRESHQKSDAKYYGTIEGYLRRTFLGMLYRCNNPKRPDYKYYGGRGIKVCFDSFKDFYDYVVNVLKVDPCGLTIDRIDNDGDYCKGNVRFITQAENTRNKSRGELHKELVVS